MKLFLAIDLPAEAKHELSTQLFSFQKEFQAFNWVPENNYHITMHFFGEISNPNSIIEQTKSALFAQESFHLYATNLNFLMNRDITIYAQFRKEQKLNQLAQSLHIAFPPYTQEFIPHITVARCRIPSKQQYFVLKKKLERFDIDISFPVNEITLFESVLLNKQTPYRNVTSFPLIGP